MKVDIDSDEGCLQGVTQTCSLVEPPRVDAPRQSPSSSIGGSSSDLNLPITAAVAIEGKVRVQLTLRLPSNTATTAVIGGGAKGEEGGQSSHHSLPPSFSGGNTREQKLPLGLCHCYQWSGCSREWELLIFAGNDGEGKTEGGTKALLAPSAVSSDSASGGCLRSEESNLRHRHWMRRESKPGRRLWPASPFLLHQVVSTVAIDAVTKTRHSLCSPICDVLLEVIVLRQGDFLFAHH